MMTDTQKGTIRRVTARQANKSDVAVIAESILTDGSRVFDVVIRDTSGRGFVTLAALGLTHAIDIRNAINAGTAYAGALV